MPGCAAVGCHNRSEKGFAMKCFPRNPKLRKLWQERVARPDWEPTNNSFLCSAHFQPEDIIIKGGRNKLRRSAIPSMFNVTPNNKSKKRKFTSAKDEIEWDNDRVTENVFDKENVHVTPNKPMRAAIKCKCRARKEIMESIEKPIRSTFSQSRNLVNSDTSTSSSDETEDLLSQRGVKMLRTVKNRLRRQRRPFMRNITNRFSDSSTSTSMESVAHGQCDNNRNNNFALQERRKNSDKTCRLSTSTSSSDEGTYRALQTRNKMPRTINNNRLRRQRRPFMRNITNRFSDSSTTTSMKSVTHGQCDNNKNNNFHSSDNETSTASTQELPKEDQGTKKVERRRVSSTIPSEIIIKTTLPEHTDYRYTLSINLLRYSKEREDNDPLTMFSREIPLEQNVYSEENIMETDSDTDDTYEPIKEKKRKCHTPCDINKSVSDVGTAEILIKLCNDKDKNILIHRLQDNVAQDKTINSKETIINESLPINRTTHLGKSDVKDEISENVLSEDTLDLMDIDERCNDFISKAFVYVTEENAESPTCSAYRNKKL